MSSLMQLVKKLRGLILRIAKIPTTLAVTSKLINAKEIWLGQMACRIGRVKEAAQQAEQVS
jgi:hypothetical protein